MENTGFVYSFAAPATTRPHKGSHTLKITPASIPEPKNNWVLVVLWILLLMGFALIAGLTYFILSG